MSRNDLEQAVYRRLNKATTTPDTATQTRIRHFLNQRHRRLLAMPGMDHLRDDTLTFASVASQSRYALPNVSALKRMWETTNDRRLFPMSLDVYRTVAPDPSAYAGTPESFVFQGYEPVSVQPSDASSLFVKSTEAADAGTCYIEGDITGGYPRTASVSITGTTAVNVSSAISTWIRVRKCYLSATQTGVITLHEDSGTGTELARIAIGQTQQKYWTFYLHPQPSAVVTYTADYTVMLTDLAQSTDEPRLPESFHALLELGATMDELTKTDDSRYLIAKSEYDDLIKDLKYWIARQSAGAVASPEFSRLGAYYPAWHP